VRARPRSAASSGGYGRSCEQVAAELVGREDGPGQLLLQRRVQRVHRCPPRPRIIAAALPPGPSPPGRCARPEPPPGRRAPERRHVLGCDPRQEAAGGLGVEEQRLHPLRDLRRPAQVRPVVPDVPPCPPEGEPLPREPLRPGKERDRGQSKRTASPDPAAISWVCPPRPKPVMSVRACTAPAGSVRSKRAASLFRRLMEAIAVWSSAARQGRAWRRW
jgi:hypothetical protein